MAGLDNYTPQMSDAIRSIVDTMLMDLYVAMPGKITKYDSATQYADVEIQLYQKFTDGTLELPPIIPNVPVKHPRANDGKARIHMPLKIDDDVIIIFSQRSLDNWKTQGGPSDPDDPRKHHITDAFALIGGSAIPDAFEVETEDAIEIVNDKGKIFLHPDGEQEFFSDKLTVTMHPEGMIEFVNDTGELIDILDQISTQTHDIAQTLSTDTVNTIFGASPLNGFATYQNIALQLSNLIAMLESFKV